MKKNDLILILILLLIAAGSYGAIRMAQKSTQDRDLPVLTPAPQTTQQQAAEPQTTEPQTTEPQAKETQATEPQTAKPQAKETQTTEAQATETLTTEPADTGAGPAQKESSHDAGQDSAAVTGQESTAATQTPAQTRTINAIRITVGNEEYGVYSLEEDQIIEVGSTNVVEIKNGQAVMAHAECPDQLCMSMGPIDSPYDLIVCLPNLVVVEGIQGRTADAQPAPEIDGVS